MVVLEWLWSVRVLLAAGFVASSLLTWLLLSDRKLPTQHRPLPTYVWFIIIGISIEAVYVGWWWTNALAPSSERVQSFIAFVLVAAAVALYCKCVARIVRARREMTS